LTKINQQNNFVWNVVISMHNHMKHIENNVSWLVIVTQINANESKSDRSLLFLWQKSNLITLFIKCQKSPYSFLVFAVPVYPTVIPAQYILIYDYSVVLN